MYFATIYKPRRVAEVRNNNKNKNGANNKNKGTRITTSNNKLLHNERRQECEIDSGVFIKLLCSGFWMPKDDLITNLCYI